MWYCQNRFKDGCDETVKSAGIVLPEPNGAIRQTIRYGKEQEDFDQICESCSRGLFTLENLRCPVCHDDWQFKRADPQKANLGTEAAPEWFYLFTCGAGHNLCSKEDILA